MEKAVLSIGIIFKNEIRCLERCLKSLQPLRDKIPCEVVMARSRGISIARGYSPHNVYRCCCA